MPGVIPFIPLIAAGAGMVAQNVQNKQQGKNVQNAMQQGGAMNAQAIQRALGREQPYLNQIKPPPQYGAGQQIGGGFMGSMGPQAGPGGGAQPGGGGQLPPQLLALLQQLHASQGRPPTMQANPILGNPGAQGRPQTMNPFGGGVGMAGGQQQVRSAAT